jgi:16S rRNA (guanine527-N7)-methyltransferase
LAIAKCIQFTKGTRILDIGTGGGFPGIPLAILFPDVEFVLVDSIGKKIKVVKDIAEKLGLSNVEGIHSRAEEVKGPFDFIVSRAVTRLVNFLPWTKNKIASIQRNSLKNGILYLKGGDLKEELEEVNKNYTLYPIADYYDEAFFESKMIVYIPLSKQA